MSILAIDPGLESSAWILCNGSGPARWGYESNPLLELRCAYLDKRHLVAIESMARMTSRNPIGLDVFNTQFWGGRFAGAYRGRVLQVTRMKAKVWLCGKAAATDSDVRTALIDRYGGERQAIGWRCKVCKGKGWRGRGREICQSCGGVGERRGPLHGVSGHVWSALAIAEYAKEHA